MAPEERREHLISAARDLVEERGLEGFTIPALAEFAGVSTPLVYKYFETRNELLAAVLAAEYLRYRDLLIEELAHGDGLEDYVRTFVTMEFDFRAPGSVLAELGGREELEHVLAEQQQADARDVGEFLVTAFRDDFPIEPLRAAFLVRVGSAASVAAAVDAARRGLDRDGTIDDVVTFILGGIEAVAEPPGPHD